MRKQFFILIFSIGLFTCGNGNKIEDSPNINTTRDSVITIIEEKTSYNPETDFINGTIQKNDGKCGFVIKVVLDGQNTLLEPGILEEKYRVDGKKVSLVFSYSRRQSMCEGMPIILIEIK